MFVSNRRLAACILSSIALSSAACDVTSMAGEPVSSLQTWTSFQNGGNLSVASEFLPMRWSPSENIAWQAAIEGYGQSSPVVSGQQVYITSTNGPNKEMYHLAAFRLSSGEKLWQSDYVNPSPIENSNYVSRAAPTPSIDSQGRLVALFEGGLVVATNKDGTTRWKRVLTSDYGLISARHGLASSIEQNERLVFIWIERSEDPYLLALDQETGSTVWKVKGLGATSWSTPRLIPVGQRKHLVCSASGRVVGFDPESGIRLWELVDLSGNTTATPIPLGRGRFLLGATVGSGEEAPATSKNSNGVIQITEREDGNFSVEYLWRAAKASSYFGSPIAVGSSAYFVNRIGIVYCLDLATGDEQFVKRTGIESMWASPLVSENRLYLFGQKGRTAVLSLDRDGTILASNDLWSETTDLPPPVEGQPIAVGPTLYAGAVASPYLILRRGDRLYAIRDNQ